MSKKSPVGLYTDGKDVVALFRTSDDGVRCDFQSLKPYGGVWWGADVQRVLKKYPCKITGVDVEEGAPQAEEVRAFKMYTDGKEVVTVHSLTGFRVNYMRDLPLDGRYHQTHNAEEFLEKYPWELDEVEVDEE